MMIQITPLSHGVSKCEKTQVVLDLVIFRRTSQRLRPAFFSKDPAIPKRLLGKTLHSEIPMNEHMDAIRKEMEAAH